MNQTDHDRRSLALHERVCGRLRADPALVERAAAILARWFAHDGPRTDRATARWRELLQAGDLDQLIAAATDPSERGDQLRQSSPLAVLLPARERWAFLREWKAANGGA